MSAIPEQIGKYRIVREIGRDPTTELLIRTIIDMGRGLGLRLIAEGVESEEQLAFLVREGCQAVQGFLFQHPMPASEFVPDRGSAMTPDGRPGPQAR